MNITRWLHRRSFLLQLVDDTSHALTVEQADNVRLRSALERERRNRDFALELVEARDKAHAELADRCRRAEQARDIHEQELAAMTDGLRWFEGSGK
jgi:hypothetical protein